MLQKVVLAIAIFIAALLALSFGETVLTQLLSWFSWLSGYVIPDLAQLMQQSVQFVQQNWLKVILAAVIAIVALLWLSQNREETLAQPSNRRKIAIILAVLLGWLGAHRFYLGQIGWGIIYLILFNIYLPLVVFIALLDALRYAFMSEQEFNLKR